MRIAVCIKEILDPEIPSRDFQVDFETKKAVGGQEKTVINPYDKNAIEVALQIKEQKDDVTITAFSLGDESSQNALRHAIAVGCEEAVLLKDPSFEGLDSLGIAKVLASGIRKAGSFDLVLCGRQAGDWDMSQVGLLVGEALSVACVTLVHTIDRQNDTLSMKREIEKGIEVVKTGMPALATITSASSNQLRFTSVKGIRLAARKTITIWSAQDLQMNEEISRAVVVDELVIPSYERQIHMIDGEDGVEKGTKLAQHLVELNLFR